MGEKSRDNWLVAWCVERGRGCVGKCDRCIRRSELRLGKGRSRGKGRQR